MHGFAEAQALAASNSDPAAALIYREFRDHVERLRDDLKKRITG